MAHSHPFVVSILDAASFAAGSSRIYKAQLCWPNNASKSRLAALRAHDASALKKEYGYDPLAEILAPRAQKTRGGADDDIDEFSTEAIAEALVPREAHLKKKEASGKTASVQRFATGRQLIFERRVYVSDDVWVVPDDSLLALKKKIQVASGIPTYRQHLWYEHDGESVSPCYAFYVGERRLDVNLWDLTRVKLFISNIPVENELYIARGRIQVRNLEFSTRLGNIWSTAPNARWFVADLNDWLSKGREKLAEIIRHDIHVRELVYYGFALKYWPAITNSTFRTFIENEPVLHEEYPELSISTSMLTRQAALETRLISDNPAPSEKKWPTTVFIKESDVAMVGEYAVQGAAVHLKNLFNYFKLEPAAPYMIARIPIGGRLYSLTKTLIGGRMPAHRFRPPIDTVCIMTVLPDLGEMFVYISSAGTYHARTEWREDVHVAVADAVRHTIEYANRVIVRINALGENVVVRPLVAMSTHNTVIANMSAVLAIRRKLTLGEFEGLKANAAKLRQAGMIHVTSQDVNTLSFHLLKGMYEYDDARFEAAIAGVPNGYEYATAVVVAQRHQAIYLRQKTCVLTSRASDVHVVIQGIRFGEMAAFVRYMLLLIQMPTPSIGPNRERKERTSTHFKEMDPLLYDLKKIYRHSVQYSQICQKPNQPAIVDAATPRSVKFWNFTTKSPAYYECRNPRWPVLYFKTGVHPANFCVPCCKKSELAPESKHTTVFEKCMKEHVYVESKDKAPSSYIVGYTPALDPGRLSYLPESSLDQLLYQQYSTTDRPLDAECIPSLGYYVFGLAQQVGHAPFFGVAACLAHALGLTPAKWIDATIARIKAAPADWSLILGGRIQSLFKSAGDFAGALLAATIKREEGPLDAARWNEIIEYAARIYWGVNIIMFVEDRVGQINVKMPPNIRHIGEFISTRHKHLLLIQNSRDGDAAPATYLPIYLVNTEEYKKTGIIAKTMFEADDKAIVIIRKMLTALISGTDLRTAVANEGAAATTIDLDLALEWIDSGDYKLEHIYVNRSNVCFAISLLKAGGASIYWPVEGSLHDHLDVPRSQKEFEYSGYSTTIAQTQEWMKQFNAWASKRGAITIDFSLWILKGDEIIGFMDGRRRYYYYFAAIKPAEARAIKDVPMIRVLYDPTAVNKLIGRSRASSEFEPQRPRCLYAHYGYHLFMLEFMAAMSRETNAGIRAKLAKILRENSPAALRDILAEWPADHEHITDIIAKITQQGAAVGSEYSGLIGRPPGQRDMTTVAEIIKNSHFAFDDAVFGELCGLEPAALAARLEPILASLVEVEPAGVKIGEWPAHIVSCGASISPSESEGHKTSQKRPDYCAGVKLRVSRADYELWRAQLVLDLKNPLKQKKMMLIAMMYVLHGQSTFVNVPDENIHIAIES